MRKEGKQLNRNTRDTITTLAGYHYSRFQSLKFFNSDRVFFINSDYTIAGNNAASLLKIKKEGSAIDSFGFEMETECTTVIDNDVYTNLLNMLFERYFPADFWRMERDGSLGGRSNAECITQTFSKAWCRNNYKNFKSLWESFSMLGITTQNSNCGMHVNVGLPNFGATYEKQEVAIRKLYYIINKYYELFKVALNRKTSSTTYCGQCRDWQEIKTKDISYMPNDHYVCMNYSHIREGRIEIRLVGGQKNFPCFRNTMETVFHLVDRVKTISWSDCDDITKVFAGCNSYVFDRLNTNCFNAGVITSAELEAIKPTIKEVRYI